MREKRERRWEAVIQEKVAMFLNTHSDLSSLITVTRVELTNKGKTAHVFLSVLPAARENQALEFAKRHAKDMRGELQRAYPGAVPFIECEIDQGEKNRVRIDELSDPSYHEE